MAATTLSVGDIAIIGVSTEDTIPGGSVANDSISFVLLKAVGSGTQIFFTDRAWNGSTLAAAGGGEGTFTYTAGADLPAGTVVTITQAQLTTAGMSLSDGGETIYAYQGAINAPTTFLHAVDIADGNTTFDGTELTNTGLVNGSTAVALGVDNAEFGTRTYNIQTPDLFAQINNNTDWVQNDNSPQDGTASNTPAYTAPDRQLWVAGSGAGEAIVTINLDGTYNSGTLGYQIVQAFQNDASLNHPSDITLDTVHDKYFFADSDAAGHNRILQGSISQLLANPGATLSTTVLYTNAGTGANGIVQSISLDTTNSIIYFDIGTTSTGSEIRKIVYDTANQTGTLLATLGADHYVTQMTIDYTHGEVYLATSQVEAVFGTDAVTQNYVYRATGLTAGSSSLTFTLLPFNPDDTGLGPEGSPLPGEAWPVERGTIRGIDVDPISHDLYIVTGSVSLDNDGDGNTTYFGGVWKYDLDSNSTGNVTLLYQQNGSTGPLGLLYYIEVDPTTGRYYVVDETGTNADPGDGAVWSGSLTTPGTPTFLATVGNFNGLGPRGLELQSAPTLSGTGLSPTYTETAGNPSANGTPVVVANNFQSTDVDSGGDANGDELAGAQVRISANFLSGSGHQDQLTINGNTSGSLTFGADTVNYSYNATLGVMTLTGITTLDNYESALALVALRVDGDNPTNYGAATTRTLSYSTFDGLLYSDEVNASATVTGVNDAPVDDNTPNSTPTGNEDAGAIAVVGLGVSDVDADPANQDIQLTLSVPNGTGVLTLNLAVVNGIVAGDITGGANGSNTVTITATQNQINATLAAANGLTFTPAANVNGTVVLTMTSNDLGLNGTDAGLTGTGTNEQDSDTVNITVTAQNDTPDLTNVGPTSSSTEQTPALLDNNVAVSDIDLDPLNSGNGLYTGASLTIARNGGANAQDSFGFDTAGALFTVSGGNLQSGASTFATFTNTGGTLTINFTSSGTAASGALVDDVLAHVTYQNTSDTPPASITLLYTFNDGSPGNGQGGGAQAATDTGTITVNITGLNDEPTLAATGVNPTFTEGGAAADIYSTVMASTVETSQTFASMTLTVSNVTDAADEILAINGTDVALTNGNVVAVGVGSAAVSVSSGTATVTLTGATLSAAALQTLIDALSYRNTSQNPTDANRVVTITQLVDSGSNVSPEDNTAALSIVSTVNVDPVNDNPNGVAVVGGGSLAVNEFVANGTLVGQVVGQDPDGNSFTYALLNDAGGRFSIDSDDGEVRVVSGLLLDNEQATSHNIQIQVTDASSANFDTGFTVTINNVDPENITGDGSANTLFGGAQADAFFGVGGSDNLHGGGGGDTIYGGSASADPADVADTLFGDAGDDTIYGNGGDDTINGGDDLDTIFGGQGIDTIHGDNGVATLGAADIVHGNRGNDIITGDGGDDTIYGDEDSDDLHGGDGADTIYGGKLQADPLDAADTIFGDAGADKLYGNGGDDELHGGSEADTLHGGAQNDKLFGDADNDVLNGGAGVDELTGGTGDDTFVFQKGQANGDTVFDFAGNGAAAGDSLQFVGYGVGATFTNVDATHWQIQDGADIEVLTFANGPVVIDPTDYTFI